MMPSIKGTTDLNTYVIKASWPATSKLIKIEAKDAEQAIAKAMKNRQIKGSETVKIVEVR